MTCPSSILLSQAFSSGASGELQSHLLSCPTCAAQWKSLEQARAAVLELPYVTPDPGRREQLRKRLLAAAAREQLPVRPSAWPRWLGLAGAAAALLAVLMGSHRLTEHSHVSHYAPPTARLVGPAELPHAIVSTRLSRNKCRIMSPCFSQEEPGSISVLSTCWPSRSLVPAAASILRAPSPACDQSQTQRP